MAVEGVELPLCVFGLVEKDKVKESQVMGWVLVSRDDNMAHGTMDIRNALRKIIKHNYNLVLKNKKNKKKSTIIILKKIHHLWH